MMLRENFRQTDKAEQAVYDEILAALQETMPEQGDRLRDLAGSLTEEYMRERRQVYQDMRPKNEAPMTEQMIVEQAYYDQKDQERREERMKRRLEDLQRKDAKSEMQASRPQPLRPPGSAQGITPSMQYGSPNKSPSWDQVERDYQQKVAAMPPLVREWHQANAGQGWLTPYAPQMPPDVRAEYERWAGPHPSKRPGPPGSAQGIAPSVQYDAPRGGGGARPVFSPRHPDFVKDADPNKVWAQQTEIWHNPKTGEAIEMPDGSYSPRPGSPWRKGTGESSTPWGEFAWHPATYQKSRTHPAFQQPRPAATASNQPFIPRMQGTDTYGHAMMLDRMQDPYADPAHLQRMRQSEAAAARSGGYPRPTQPSFGPIERTYRA
jgi:hypothetical protein